MSFKFKPIDFNSVFQDLDYQRDEKLAAMCNTLLEAHLKALPKVFLFNINDCSVISWSKDEHETGLHSSALLWDVKEIEK